MLNLILVLAGVCAVGMAMPLPDFYSYSPAVGDGSGVSFSTAHESRITGIRIWEYPNAYITGIQLKYGNDWTDVVGGTYVNLMEWTLNDNEFIIQVSGKYDYSYYSYIYQLMFVTNKGRIFKVGQPSGTSFNFYPAHDGAELRFLSGRQNGNGITSIGAHWAMYYPSQTTTTGTTTAVPS
nr:zymogen granule membrane protein 16-like [Misgurnus anguillicaudatus]XP_055067397.1 zymogen granule membrane protein 16-like [Misgurnus anguillicaudatus]